MRGISDARIRRVVNHVLRALRKERESLGVHLIGDTRMRGLNRRYRGKDKTTDVLSFGLREGFSLKRGTEAGDIFLCLPQIRRQAEAYGISFQEECLRMLIHGILHIFGYDHVNGRGAKRMFSLQERLVRAIE